MERKNDVKRVRLPTFSPSWLLSSPLHSWSSSCSGSLVSIHGNTESFDWFLEDQALSLPCDLAPPNTLPPLSRNKFPLFLVFMCVAELIGRRVVGVGYRVGEEPNHTMEKKPSPLKIIQSLPHCLASRAGYSVVWLIDSRPLKFTEKITIPIQRLRMTHYCKKVDCIIW